MGSRRLGGFLSVVKISCLFYSHSSHHYKDTLGDYFFEWPLGDDFVNIRGLE